MTNQVKLGDFIGTALEEDFSQFDITDIQEVLHNLASTDAIDLAHAELLQQQALRAADILTEYLAKIVKTIGYLEAEVNSVRNRVSLEYQAAEGRTTTDMKIWAGNASSEVKDLQVKLSSAKGAKMALEKKYDILVREHHQYKDIAQGLRRTILGYGGPMPPEKVPEGYE